MSLWALTIAPQTDDPKEFQPVSKTGTIDDTFVLDSTPWLGEVLAARMMHRPRKSLLFSVPAGRLNALLQAMLRDLALPPLCLYQLRHGGASADLLARARSAAEVKARGRWRSDSSLRRYGKPAATQRLLAKLTPAQRTYGQRCFDRMAQVLRNEVAPVAPPSARLQTAALVGSPLSSGTRSRRVC